MKKFLLFAGVLYVLFLVSFKEKSREPESFVKILKDHPERLQELLKVADIYRDTVKISEKILSPKDILSAKQLDIFRSKTKSRPCNPAHPVIIISTVAMNELIKNHLNTGDSIVFYLGKYSNDDPQRITRYNERNSSSNEKSEKLPYTYKNLKKRTAFAMQVFSNVYQQDSKGKNSSALFTPVNFIGLNGKGSHDSEDLLNGSFGVAKKAVSEVYEFSRLCPPPKEGCF